jgi:hypothetical protein
MLCEQNSCNGKEPFEYTNTKKNQPEQRLNSIAYKTANNIELNFEKKCTGIIKLDKLNRPKPKEILDKIPTEQKYKTKEGSYTVAKR